MSTVRIVIHSSVVTKFQRLFKEAVDKTLNSFPNKPALITSVSAKRNQALVQDALPKGAQLVHGDERSTSAAEGDVATKMPATVLGGVNKEMKLHVTDLFGPDVSLFTLNPNERHFSWQMTPRTDCRRQSLPKTSPWPSVLLITWSLVPYTSTP